MNIMTLTVKRVRALALAALMATAVPAAAAEPATSEIEVAIGRQVFVVPNGQITRFALGDPAIAATTLVGRQIRILGTKAGRTDLVVWNGTRRISEKWTLVVSPDVDGLRRALADEAGLADAITIVTEAGGPAVLRGRLTELDQHQRMMALARAHLGEGFLDRTTIAGPYTVAVDIKFAAVSVNSLKAMGFNLAAFGRNTHFATTAPSTVTSFNFREGTSSIEAGLPLSDVFNLFLHRMGGARDIVAILGLLAKTDLAQLLAEPTLLVRSGEQASFLAGGEVPIPVPQAGSSGTSIAIEYKPFGVRLEIAPVVISPDRIVLTVSPEVSELDFSNGLSVQGFTVPAFRKRATTTTVELGNGQSLVLAGLLYSTNGNVDERVPGLGDLPVIGAFFKRVRAIREQQELVIIATPRLVSPLERGTDVPLPGAGLKLDPTFGDMLMGRNIAAEAASMSGLVE